MAIGAQSVRQSPGVVAISFVAAGRFALAVAPGAGRVDGVDADASVEEVFDHATETGFDGHAHARESGNFLG